ncbi:MAG: hypothetical protein WB660_07815 [Candidatus Sulfotelmatobacter sp.]
MCRLANVAKRFFGCAATEVVLQRGHQVRDGFRALKFAKCLDQARQTPPAQSPQEALLHVVGMPLSKGTGGCISHPLFPVCRHRIGNAPFENQILQQNILGPEFRQGSYGTLSRYKNGALLFVV